VALVSLVLVDPAGAARIQAFNGEWVDVEGTRDQEVADLVASFPHGTELGELRVQVTSAEDAKRRCRGGIACYFPNSETLVMPDGVEGYAWEQVLAHEYGHHIATNRLNPPWDAVDFGPKRWATAAEVCEKDREGMLLGYAHDPGEAFAETYRLLVSALAATWTPFPVVVDETLFSMSAEVQAAVLEDVRNPWTGPRTLTVTRRLRAGATAVIPLATPLDGNVEAELVRGRGRLRLGASSGRAVYGTVCGARTTRLTLKASRTGVVRVSVTVP
jgi:hypothetical protein